MRRFGFGITLIYFVYVSKFDTEAQMTKLHSPKDTLKMNATNEKFMKTFINQTDLFTNWSPWSRCISCSKKRMKQCISPLCNNLRFFEEKPCDRKRCKRKYKQTFKFNVVHVDNNKNWMRQSRSRIWSRWSNWSPCSQTCRTQRLRNCRKPGRCRKNQQKQTAYCYHKNSMCESYVYDLMRTHGKPFENQKYQYNTAEIRGRQSKNCGQPFRKSRMLKIIGGVESRRNKWPWHVAILNKYFEVFCGGTLIAPKWVLTASHCIRPYLRVRLNEHDLRSRDGREIEMTVQKIFQHPKFNHKTVDNDIALLKLPKSVNLPIACLPNHSPRPTEICSVMGWGKLWPNDTYGTHKLYEAKLPLVHSDICRRSYRHFLITSNMLCAGWPSGKADTCAGDSGGGLMCPSKQNKPTTQTYSVQGITSFGDGCGLRNKYGIYTSVFNYLKWIYYIIDHYS